MKTVFRIASILFLVYACARAQSLSSLSGLVTDPTEAVVPGARITITNTGTNQKRTTETDVTGRYSFPMTPPGRYVITAEFSGFQTVTIENVELLVNNPATVDIQFAAMGQVTQSIAVSAEAVQINTQDATLGNAIGTRPILQLPLFARDPVKLLALQPGVSYYGVNDGSDRNGSTNGSRNDQNNITLDGVDVNDQVSKSPFESSLRTTLDSVQEFRTITANSNAEFGRTSGSQVALVTKSGTNDLHGSLYWFHRNTVTAANGFFNNLSGVERPKLLINVFGGSAGGPVVKNRAFYFFNFEGRRNASDASVTRTVPGPDMRNGIVHYLRSDGSVATLRPEDIKRIDPLGIGVNPAVLSVLKSYPEPNDKTQGDGLNTFGVRFNAPVRSRQNTYISRWDFLLDRNGHHALFVRGNLQNDHGDGVPWFPGQPPASVDLANAKGVAVGLNSVLAPNLILTLRYGLTRPSWESTGVQTASIVGFKGLDDPIATTRGRSTQVPVHTAQGTLSWQKSRHEIQAGGVMRFIDIGRNSLANSFHAAWTDITEMKCLGCDLLDQIPDFDESSRATLGNALTAVMGLITAGNARYNYDIKGNVQPVGSPVRRDFASEEYELFVQDTWRITRGLTLTAGLRYSLMPPYRETNGAQITAIPSPSEFFYKRAALAAAGLSQEGAGRISYVARSDPQGKPLYPYHKKNFGPRIALAYSPQGSSGWQKLLFGGPGKSVIRAGWGLFYDLFGSGLMQRAEARAPGFSTSLQNRGGALSASTAPRFTSLFDLPSAVVRPAPPGGFPQTPPDDGFATTGLPDDQLKPPYAMNMNFTIGRELGGGFYVEGSYVGRLSRRTLEMMDIAMPTNLVDPKSGQDYFTAAKILANNIKAGVATKDVKPIPFWENFYPGAAGNGLTATQAIYNHYQDYAPSWSDALMGLDLWCEVGACNILGPGAQFNPQYYALGTWMSVGTASYHAMQWTLRKRFSHGVLFDLNYVLSKSLDLSSRPERSGYSYGDNVILNSWQRRQLRAVSDFDARHRLNAHFVAELPFGRGRKLLGNAGKGLDALIGGWQLSGVYFCSSGLPFSVGNGDAWPTNWNVEGYATQVGPVPKTKATKNAPAVAGDPGPNAWPDPRLAIKAYDFTLPGESGQRNGLRSHWFANLDLGVGKRFLLPYAEGHSLQIRWEIFNVPNSVHFGEPSAGFWEPGSFGKYFYTRTEPRQMQFGLRYEF